MNSQPHNAGSPFGFTAAHRRSALVATICFLLVGAILPGRICYQKLEVLDSTGTVQQAFLLETTDPRLAVLADSIKATQLAKTSKPDQYYTSRWEMELAAIYAKDMRFAKPQEPTERIAQASYIVQPDGATNASTANAQYNPQLTDWTSYWKDLQVESTSRVQQYQQPASSDSIQVRTRLAEIVPGPRRTFWFIVQVSLAVTTFVVMLRLQTQPTNIFRMLNLGASFAPKQTVKRLPLHCVQQMSLPAEMYVVRKTLAVRLQGLGWWLPTEIILAALVTVYTATYLLFHA